MPLVIHMTDRAAPAGWVVQVTPIPPPLPRVERWTDSSEPVQPLRYFNVAIADPEKAVEAVKKHSAKDKDDPHNVDMRTVRALSSAEIAVLKLKAGEVKPA